MRKPPDIGQRVKHVVFGKGRIVAARGTVGTTNGDFITIRFDDGTEKELVWAFCVDKVRKLAGPKPKGSR